MLHLAPELRAEKPLAAEPQPPASSEGLGLRAQSSSGSPLWPPLAWLRGLRAGKLTRLAQGSGQAGPTRQQLALGPSHGHPHSTWQTLWACHAAGHRPGQLETKEALQFCLPAWTPQQAWEPRQHPGLKPGETGNISCPGDLRVGATPTLNTWDYQREGPGRFS